ncbi:MAG: DUF4115 domain-containing protein [Rhodospirillaceae bacterium]|nr:DUF4115 domain-containing protein [Rhodospirillaceae bacterium]
MEQQNMPTAPQTEGTQQAEADAPVKGSVGALLRASRVRLGVDLEGIAETLRIRRVYLEAIEDGRYEDLPGDTYAVGFIRSYAEQLGLDGVELVRRFKKDARDARGEEAVPEQPASFPKPVKTLGLPIGAILTGVVVVGLLVFGGWYLFSAGDSVSLLPKIPAALNEKVGAVSAPRPILEGEDVASTKDAKPEEKTDSALKSEDVKPEAAAVPPAPKSEAVKPVVKTEVAKPAPKPEVTKPVAKPEAAKPVVKTEMANPVPKPEVTKPVAKPEVAKPAPNPEAAKPVAAVSESAAQPEVVQPAATHGAEGLSETPEDVSREPRVYGAENAGARVEIVATGESWVQVTENGNLVLTRLMRAGDRFKAPNRPGLLLMTGNAGGLDVVIDGQKVKRLGAAGQVMRDVPLTPDHLRVATQTPE